MIVFGASEHTFGAQAAAEVWDEGAEQFPSVPIYYKQVVLVPVYELHNPKVSIHPAPVVMQPAKKEAQAAFVVEVVGASTQVLSEHDAVVEEVPLHNPSDPIYEEQVVVVPV